MREKPSALNTYTAIVTLLGFVALALSVAASDFEAPFGPQPVIFLLFVVLFIVTELRPMLYFVDGGEVTASWTFTFALLFMAPPGVTLIAVAVTAIIVDGRASKSINRTLFNAAQFVLSLAVGAALGSAIAPLMLQPGQSPDIYWVLAATVAGSVAFGLNSLLISVVIALHRGMPVIDTLRRTFTVNLGMDGLLLALAPVFAVIGLNAPLLVGPLLVTVAVIFRSASIALNNRHEATHDLLTGISNRRLFEDQSVMLLAGASAAGERAALIHFDLDGFKGINDRLGHHYGDEVLKEVARRLTEARRATDHVARLGGDEFAVLIGRIDDSEEALVIARRLLAGIEEPMEIEGVPIGISASFGVAIFPDHGEDLPILTHHADMASYVAKRSATGVEMWSAGESSSTGGRLSILADLRGAMDNDELALVFQPLVSAETGEIVSLEALVRWNHPVRGLIMPETFIRQAEQTDLVTPITDLVISMAVEQCVAWQKLGINLRVAVNVSARNLHDLRFPGRISAILDAHGLDASCLEVEVTENTVMADPVRSGSVLGHLRALGILIAIDDFGTGYSSLASLRQLTIDRIKIDKSFITNLDTNESDLMIARSVIELGNNLGLVTVAEGVETPEVLRIVRELGCQEAQGYLFSHPLPAAELTATLLKAQEAADPVEARPILETAAGEP